MSDAKKGRHFSLETRQKMSMAHKGKTHGFKKGFKPWNAGLTKETDLRLARNAKRMLGNQRSKGCAPWNKGKKMVKDKYPKYWSKERLRKVIMKPHAEPNEKEVLLTNILQNTAPNEYKYVGNGALIIGGYCPDFMNVNGKKKLIELWGDYWHRNHNPQKRIAYFKEFGFETLVIWEHELKDFDNLSKKIIGFNENHSLVNFLAV